LRQMRYDVPAMAQEILINAGAAEIRVATVEDGRLQALTTATAFGGAQGRIGEVVLGRVQKLVPAIQAAFVDIGTKQAGFLGCREAKSLTRGGEGDCEIGDCVREGEAVLVQIVKDTIGEKGARLSAAVTVPGRLCVLTPFQPGVSLSRRILDEAERARLADLGERVLASGAAAEGAGLILRTNAYGAGFDELNEEIEILSEIWRDIVEAKRQARPPVVLHRDLDPVAQTLRDVVRDDTVRILIDDAAAADAARVYCRAALPHMECRIEMFSGPGALFDAYDIETDIEALFHPRVALPCGGWITVEQTEALCAVDVNSGRFTAASGLEDTAATVNLEAAEELGRQIRLRGIGGVIVVDFIHVQNEAVMAAVVRALERSLARDGCPVRIAPLSPFGLVEITRKRLRAARETLTGEPCPACRGHGRIRRSASVAMEVMRQIEAAARAAPGAAIRVTAAPDVIGWIEAQGEPLIAALAKKGAVRIAFVRDAALTREQFDVGTTV
jgi:ribonuclease G